MIVVVLTCNPKSKMSEISAQHRLNIDEKVSNANGLISAHGLNDMPHLTLFLNINGGCHLS